MINDYTYKTEYHRCYDYLEAISLVDQESLSFVTIEHFLRILRHKRVEKRVVLF